MVEDNVSIYIQIFEPFSRNWIGVKMELFSRALCYVKENNSKISLGV